MEDYFKIINVAPNLIQIEVTDIDKFKDNGKFTIGSYLKISDEKKTSIIAIVQSFKIKDTNQGGEAEIIQPTFILDAQPIGFLDEKGNFTRGGQQITIPPNEVSIADTAILEKIYADTEEDKKFIFSSLAQNNEIEIAVDGDKFFSKHIAVVGSTGSGKSGTVAKILQEGIKPNEQQKKASILNNSHIILFDLHGEYAPAFPDANLLNVDTLKLPYWLMNSEELEEIFIESNENNSHNQISQFKNAVTLNKKKYNTGLEKINYDTPVYFSIDEVFNYISNLNELTTYTSGGKTYFATLSEKIEYDKNKLWELMKFEKSSTSKHEVFDVKVSKSGGFNGEFDRFVPRLETKLNDDRLSFLLKPRKDDGLEYKTDDLPDLLKQFLGYADKGESNITIIDLSGIPFEVLSLVVSLISRLVFDFCFHYKSIKKDKEVPYLLVLEEAHNYIPQSQGSRYNSVKKSIERIAKEGRKYGLSLMIVSQRPSEISETIFSQCNNFVAMRLTNPTDQQYMKRLMPDSVSAITNALPSLERQEALVIGDSIPMPTIVKINDLEHKPASNDINFRSEWKKDWNEIAFKELVNKLIY